MQTLKFLRMRILFFRDIIQFKLCLHNKFFYLYLEQDNPDKKICQKPFFPK